ncbi:hypothetical protein A4V12_24570 [Streptomyces noursei]|nr:hypothetical protein A4V12_24570 [Streptomyces noursei]
MRRSIQPCSSLAHTAASGSSAAVLEIAEERHDGAGLTSGEQRQPVARLVHQKANWGGALCRAPALVRRVVGVQGPLRTIMVS